jgi:spermidine/putrescine transport system substrate-binding protein
MNHNRWALLLIGVLVVCYAPLAVTAQSDFWECPHEVAGQTLHVYNWTTYIAEDTISNFERLCGVTVQYDTYASDSDMVDELRAAPNTTYDVVVPTDATLYGMIEEGLLQPLVRSEIMQLANMDTTFVNGPFDPGNVYTVPYQWGTDGVGYNRAKIGHDVTSWDEVFNYTGTVAWIDEPRIMLGIALKVLGLDPNTTDPAQIQQAGQYLIDHSANLYAVAPDTGQDMLAARQADIVIEYSGDIFQVIADCQCQDFAYAIPSEGSVIWIDSLAIPVGAPNKALAQIFINYIMFPQVGADIANFTAYGSPNRVAIAENLIESQYLDNPAIYPNSEVQARLFFIQSTATMEQLYGDEWARVRAAVGK